MRSLTRLATMAAVLLLSLFAACSDEDSPTGPPERTVHGITAPPGTVSMRIGETVVLLVTVDADSGAVKTVTWQSVDPRRVTVSATGIITAVAPGIAVITATSTAD